MAECKKKERNNGLGKGQKDSGRKDRSGKKGGTYRVADLFGIGAGFGPSAAAERSKKKKNS